MPRFDCQLFRRCRFHFFRLMRLPLLRSFLSFAPPFLLIFISSYVDIAFSLSLAAIAHARLPRCDIIDLPPLLRFRFRLRAITPFDISLCHDAYFTPPLLYWGFSSAFHYAIFFSIFDAEMPPPFRHWLLFVYFFIVSFLSLMIFIVIFSLLHIFISPYFLSFRLIFLSIIFSHYIYAIFAWYFISFHFHCFIAIYCLLLLPLIDIDIGFIDYIDIFHWFSFISLILIYYAIIDLFRFLRWLRCRWCRDYLLIDYAIDSLLWCHYFLLSRFFSLILIIFDALILMIDACITFIFLRLLIADSFADFSFFAVSLSLYFHAAPITLSRRSLSYHAMP